LLPPDEAHVGRLDHRVAGLSVANETFGFQSKPSAPRGTPGVEVGPLVILFSLLLS
jgi:hypothetical protein